MNISAGTTTFKEITLFARLTMGSVDRRMSPANRLTSQAGGKFFLKTLAQPRNFLDWLPGAPERGGRRAPALRRAPPVRARRRPIARARRPPGAPGGPAMAYQVVPLVAGSVCALAPESSATPAAAAR